MLGHRPKTNLPAMIALAAFLLPTLVIGQGTAEACPFCTALVPTLSQQRESADVVALGEVQHDVPGGKQALLRVHQVFKHGGRPGPWKRASNDGLLTTPTDRPLRQGTLCVMFGRWEPSDKDPGNGPGDGGEDADAWHWTLQPVDETSIGYFARAPGLRTPPQERLTYFAAFLEHADPLIAEDAYQEFGHAEYDDVTAVADRFDAERLRAWIVDERLPPHRKGFYGLALGLTARGEHRGPNVELLQRLIATPASDLRAGFDGILGGHLVAEGEAALRQIEESILANPRSADGDVRHAVSALRFYQQYGSEISTPRLARAMRHLLARPEMASLAIVELARWEDSAAIGLISPLYDRSDYPQPATGRAVVGYLSVIRDDSAAAALAELRRRDPAGVAEAEDHLARFGTTRE